MDVGMMMVFASYGWDDCSDARVWDEEIRLARLAADLGFDCLLATALNWSTGELFAEAIRIALPGAFNIEALGKATPRAA